MYKRIFFAVFCLTAFFLHAQEADIQTEKRQVEANIRAEQPDGTRYKITEIVYKISGLTKQTPLSKAVPIEKDTLFFSKEELEEYIETLNIEFKNLRTLESHRIETEFLPAEDGLIPVKLTIYTKDTWNIIALPYPRFDSNSGFQLKLKVKDFNFFGFMQTLNVDVVYENDENEKSAFSFKTDFAIPFKAGPVDLTWDIKAGLAFKEKQKPEFEFSTGLDAAYTYKNITLHAGFIQGINIYGLQQPKTPADKTGEDSDSKKDQASSSYYFTDTFYLYMPVEIYKTQSAGVLTWTPYFSLGGNWKFGKITDEKLRGMKVKWSHTLAMGKINWHKNFRHGYSFEVDNAYEYNTLWDKVNISFSANSNGFYSFWDRIGLYGNFNFFYNLHGKTSNKAGEQLRGILNKRVSTDTAFTLNMDFPIKIGLFKFEEITGIQWTRFLGFELHVVPFLDIALTHDIKSGTYFNPKHGWYSGGMEIIVYPVKMRSIYGRISIGQDLTGIKTFKDLFRLRRISERDGLPATEIFIGIGLHY